MLFPLLLDLAALPRRLMSEYHVIMRMPHCAAVACDQAQCHVEYPAACNPLSVPLLVLDGDSVDSHGEMQAWVDV